MKGLGGEISYIYNIGEHIYVHCKLYLISSWDSLARECAIPFFSIYM